MLPKPVPAVPPEPHPQRPRQAARVWPRVAEARDPGRLGRGVGGRSRESRPEVMTRSAGGRAGGGRGPPAPIPRRPSGARAGGMTRRRLAC